MEVRKRTQPDVLDATQWKIGDDNPLVEVVDSSYADVTLDYLARRSTFTYRDKLGYRHAAHAFCVPPGRAAIPIMPMDYILSAGEHIVGVLTPDEIAEQFCPTDSGR